MRVILVSLFILGISGLLVAGYFYKSNLKPPLFTIQTFPPEETKQTTQEEISIKEQTTQQEVAKAKEIPESLLKYQNLPADMQVSTIKDLVKNRENDMILSDLAENLELFSQIYKTNSYNNALNLIDQGGGEIVFRNLDKFNITDTPRQEELIKKIRARDQFYLVAQNYNFFKLSAKREKEIFDQLFEKHTEDLLNNFEKFKQIPSSSHNDLINSFFDKDRQYQKKYNWYSGVTCSALKNLPKFYALTEKNKKDFIDRIFDNNYKCADEILHNIKQYKIVSSDTRLVILVKLLEQGYYDMLIDFIPDFNLSSEQQLIFAKRYVDNKKGLEDLRIGINFFNEDIREDVLKLLDKK